VAFYGPLKRRWQAILDEWKTKKNTKSNTITKQAFPALLKQLCLSICEGDEVQGLSATSLISGFRKCGIFPLNRKPVLDRLPSESTGDTTDSATAGALAESVVKVLREMRYSGQSQSGTKMKTARIDVEPGRSISWDDISTGTEQTPSTAVKRPCCQKRKSSGVSTVPKKKKTNDELDSDDLASEVTDDYCEDSSDEYADNSPARENSDSEENCDTHGAVTDNCGGTGTSTMGNDNIISQDTVYSEQSIEVGQHIIAGFSVGKTCKHYLGEIMENGCCDDYEVSFLRKSKLLNHFRHPNVPDICVITQSQVVAAKIPNQCMAEGRDR